MTPRVNGTPHSACRRARVGYGGFGKQRPMRIVQQRRARNQSHDDRAIPCVDWCLTLDWSRLSAMSMSLVRVVARSLSGAANHQYERIVWKKHKKLLGEATLRASHTHRRLLSTMHI